jgi:tetratricopeptide (TPR) repeat protein
MPKPIKKKVTKKSKPAEDIKSTLVHAREFYGKRKNTAIKSAAVVLSILILVAGLWFYQRYRAGQAEAHETAGYNALHNVYQQGKTEEERFKTALDELNEAYALKKSPVTLFYIASVRQSMGKAAEAEETLKKLIADYPAANDVVALAWYKLFEIYKSAGRDDQALEALRSLYELKGVFYKDAALSEWARLLSGRDKKADAAAKYEELIKSYPASPYVEDAKAELKAMKEQAEKGQAEKSAAPADKKDASSADKKDAAGDLKGSPRVRKTPGRK